MTKQRFVIGVMLTPLALVVVSLACFAAAGQATRWWLALNAFTVAVQTSVLARRLARGSV